MTRTVAQTILAIGNSAELMLVLKTTLVVAVGLTIAWTIRSARASVRHLVLAATFGVLLALPIAVLLVPPVHFELPDSASVVSAPLQITQSTTTGDRSRAVENVTTPTTKLRTTISPLWLVRLAWGLGMALFLTSFSIGLWRLQRTRRSSLPWLEKQETLRNLAVEAGIHREVDVLVHDYFAVPVTCGLLRPAILLPADARTWSEDDLHRVFVHELEHIKRFDWLVHILTRAVCAIYWFHPMVWMAWRQLCLEAERSCDDAVVLQTERADYAEQLVVSARRLSGALAPPVLSMANRSDLSRRVSAILNRNQSRGRAGLVSASLAFAVATVLLFGVAPMRAVKSQSTASQTAAKKTQSITSPQQRALNRALLESAEEGKIEEIVQLLDAGADINAAIDGDGSALIVAAKSGAGGVVKLLLDRGADVNMGVEGDGNPLIAAAGSGYGEIVAMLLEKGANVNMIVPRDENALIQASGSGHLSVVKMLVSHGADVNARVWSGDSDGEWRTALGMARRRNHGSVVEFLISAGARE